MAEFHSLKRQGGWIGAAIGAVAGLVGGHLANRSREGTAAHQAEFQERMSNTAWQRGIADMQAAGLNPMLAYSQGPATSPPGAQAAHLENVGLSATQGAAAGSSAEEADARTERTRQETMSNEKLAEKLEAEIHEVRARERREGASAVMIQNQTEKVYQEMRQEKIAAEVAEKFGMPRAVGEYEVLLADVKAARIEGKIDETQYGEILRFIDRAMKLFRGLFGFGIFRGSTGGAGAQPQRRQ